VGHTELDSAGTKTAMHENDNSHLAVPKLRSDCPYTHTEEGFMTCHVRGVGHNATENEGRLVELLE
jgi:hypothetical protein